MATKQNPHNVLSIAQPEVMTVPVTALPNPLSDSESANLNIRIVPGSEGKTHSERVRAAWDVDDLMNVIHNSPQHEMFGPTNLIEVEVVDGAITRIIDGNRRTCSYHLLSDMYPEGTKVKREQVTKAGDKARTVTLDKDYSSITVRAYEGPLSDEQFNYLQRRDVGTRKGLGKIEFYNILFMAYDETGGVISEREQELRIGPEIIKGAFPNRKVGDALRETLQNPKRVWKMPRFVREQFMAKVRDTKKEQTKPTGGDIRKLWSIFSQAKKEDKLGLLTNGIASVEEMEGVITELGDTAAAIKAREFLNCWAEVMEGNGKKGGGKSSASKSGADLDAARASLEQAGRSMAPILIRWARNDAGGYGKEEVFKVLRDYFSAADAALRASSPDDHRQLWSAVESALG